MVGLRDTDYIGDNQFVVFAFTAVAPLFSNPDEVKLKGKENHSPQLFTINVISGTWPCKRRGWTYAMELLQLFIVAFSFGSHGF